MKQSEWIWFVRNALERCDELRQAQFWNATPRIYSEGACISFLVNLKDALILLDRAGERIDFADFVEGAEDITHLVVDMRNAACHIGSADRIVRDSNRVIYCVAQGRGGAIKIDEIGLDNPFEDDVAIFYGTLRLFVVRHIDRALTEAWGRLQRIAQTAGEPVPQRYR